MSNGLPEYDISNILANPLIGALMGMAESLPAPDTGETAREAQRALGASLRGRQGLATPEGPPASEAIQAGPQAPPTGPQWIGPPDARYRVDSGGPGTPDQAVAQLGAYRRRQGPEDVEQVGGRTLIYGGAPTQPRLIPAEEDAVMTARVQLQAALDVQRQMPPGTALQFQPMVDQRIKQLQAAQAAQSAIQAPTPREVQERGQGGFPGGGAAGGFPAGAAVTHRFDPKTNRWIASEVRTAAGAESRSRADAEQIAAGENLKPGTVEYRDRVNTLVAGTTAKKAEAGAAGAKRGSFEASLDLPVTKTEAAYYQLPANTTRREMLAKPNLYGVTESDIDVGTQFAAARAMLNEYREVATRLLTATDAAGSLGQRVKLAYGAFVRTDEDAVRLRALQATVPLLVRALGEKGTLATADVQRALDAVPDFADTQQSSAAKIKQLEEFMANVERNIGVFRPGVPQRRAQAAGAATAQPTGNTLPAEARAAAAKRGARPGQTVKWKGQVYTY